MSCLACRRIFYGSEHNAKWETHEYEFWRSWNPNMKHTNRLSSKSGWKKWDHMYSYNVYSQSYGH